MSVRALSRAVLAAGSTAIAAASTVLALHLAAAAAPAAVVPPWQEAADHRDFTINTARQVCARLDAGTSPEAVRAWLVASTDVVTAGAVYAYALDQFCPLHARLHRG